MTGKDDVAKTIAEAAAGMLGESGTTTIVTEQSHYERVIELLAKAPSVEEVLGKPDVYRAWLAKAQEALNG